MSHPLCYPAHMKNKLYVHKHTIASASPILGAFQTWVVSLTPCFNKVCQPPLDLQRFQPFPPPASDAPYFAMHFLGQIPSAEGPQFQPPVASNCIKLHQVALKHFISSLA